MKYCPNCGKEVSEDIKFCPNCGKDMTSNSNNNEQVQNNNNNKKNSGAPSVQERNIVTCILLSIVTCGIYGIIWFIGLVDDVNRICNDEKSSQSGGTVFLLTLVTCGIYGIIWFYECGRRLSVAGNKYGKQIQDNSTIYLILSIFGLQIVAYCMVQNDLNKFAQ